MAFIICASYGDSGTQDQHWPKNWLCTQETIHWSYKYRQI